MRAVDLVRYKDLVWVLVTTHLRVKYKSTYLGFLWSILNPLLMMIILSFVFMKIMRVDIGTYIHGLIFPVFLLLGQTYWRFFQMGTTQGMHSVVNNTGIIKRVWFPREVVVIASVIASTIIAFLELMVFFGVLGMFELYFWRTGHELIPVHAAGLFLLVMLAMTALLILGISLILAPLYVRYRDLEEIWQVVTLAGFFLTPVLYPITFFADTGIRWVNPVMTLNPLARFIHMSHMAIFDGSLPSLYKFILPLAVTLLVLAAGHMFFKSRERHFREHL